MPSQLKKSTPNCARIWNFIYSLKGIYERYADDIDDICCADSLTDHKGLTVIIPDKDFMDHFHNNIHGDGSASVAKRVLMNTIIRRDLSDVEDFEELGSSIPFRSGLTMKLESTDPKKNIVNFSNNITIKKRKDFEAPRGFGYAVWEVKGGLWPTEISYEVKRKKFKIDKKSITGGGNYIVNVGRALQNSDDARRVGLVSSILMEYKTSLMKRQRKEKVPNPLLLKCVSLYNWLSIYRKDVLEEILVVTDISPGVNLLLQFLDPNSAIDDDILFGTGNKNDPVAIRNGWRNTTITNNPHEEWKSYLTKAGNWSTQIDKYNKDLLSIRNNLATKGKVEIGTVGKTITDIYNKFPSYVSKYITDKHVAETLNRRYSNEFKGRKQWEDQLRYVGTSTFAGLDNLTLTVLPEEITESLQSTISFRPINTEGSYEQAATFTYEGGRFMSQEDYFLAMKWIYSTDFMFMPVTIESNSLALYKPNQKPYNGTIDSPITYSAIINCHRINYELLMNNSELYFASPEVMYGINWTLRQNANGEHVSEMLSKLNMDGYKSNSDQQPFDRIGGDPLVSGGKDLKTNKRKKRNIQRCIESESSDELDDDLCNLANLTFLVRPQREKCLLQED